MSKSNNWAIRLEQSPDFRHLPDVESLPQSWETSLEFIKAFNQSNQQDLHDENENYQTVLALLSEGVCLFDANAQVVFCNEQYLKIYKLSEGDVGYGTTLPEIYAKRAAVGTLLHDSVEAFVSFVETLKSTPEPKYFKGKLQDGRIILICGKALNDGRIVSTHLDITEREHGNISLQTLMDWIPAYVWVKDTDSKFVIANKALAHDSGFANTTDIIGHSDRDLHPTDTAEGFRNTEQKILKERHPHIAMEEFVVDKTGKERWLLSTKVPVSNDYGEIFGLVGISYDITERKRTEAFNAGYAQLLEMIMTARPLAEVLDELMLLIERRIDNVFASILTLDSDGIHVHHASAPSLPKDYVQAINGAAIGPKMGSCGTAMYRGEPVFVEDIATDPLWEDFRPLALGFGLKSCWSTPIKSKRGGVLGSFALYSNTERLPTADEIAVIEMAVRVAGIAIERKHDDDHINFLANYDFLTGLPNRVLLKQRTEQACAAALKDNSGLSLIFIDLDNFKYVNDSLDHRSGDILLRTVAQRMRDCVSYCDTVARFGGDEFVILIAERQQDVEEFGLFLQKLLNAIAAPILIAGRELSVTASVGVANFPENCQTVDGLIGAADAAMYRAKENGGNSYQFYTHDLNARLHQKLQLQEDLRLALLEDQLSLNYQPQVDLKSGQIFGAEALVRWHHPKLGMVSPAVFIPIAEESGLIVKLGDWVLRESCRQNKAWQDAGHAPISICVNISARQFKEKNFVHTVIDALHDSGLAAQYLELELTESMIMQDKDEATVMMKELRKIGVEIAIDDFGTGYSSLSALKKFPIGRLKIDKSFVDEIGDDEDDKVVVTTIIVLGHQLGMKVIAEGVETDAQRQFLCDNHCDEMQGYLFSKPVTANALSKLLAAQPA